MSTKHAYILEDCLQTEWPVNPSTDDEIERYEQEVTNTIYRFAENESEWFNLLLGISSCLSIASDTTPSHPLYGLSNRLLSHLRTALKLSLKLEHANQALTQTFSLIPIGVGLIAEDGRVMGMNQVAVGLIKDSQDLSYCQEKMTYRGQSIHALLEASSKDDPVSSAIAVDLGCSRTGTLHLMRMRGSDSESVSSSFELAKTFCYFSIVTDQDTPLNLQLFKQAYQLTNTEAQVLAVMIHEPSVAGIADELMLKPVTVRDHLSNIYQKLGVSRKPDLVRKVLMESLIRIPVGEGQTVRKINQQGRVEKKFEESKYNETHSLPKLLYLPDGRRLAFRDIHPFVAPDPLTDSKATPRTNVLVLHNIMGSCFETPLCGERYASENNIRLIIPDRPGYGESDTLDQADFKQWCQDIEFLLDDLKLDQVHVLGHSLGGSYSMALAEMLPERIIRVALVSPVPRVADMKSVLKMPILLRASLQAIRHAPFLIEPMIKMLLGNDLEKFYRRQLSFVRPQAEGRAADQLLLEQKGFYSYSMTNFKRSLMQGTGAWAQELKFGFSEWSFSLCNREMEYQIWHGTSDDVVTIEMIENLASDIKVTHFRRLNNETHMLFHRHFVDILGALVRPD